MKRFMLRLIFTISLIVSSTTLWSMELSSGIKQLYLQQTDGQEKEIGDIEFTALEAGLYQYKITLDHHLFKDYFLSMKEMKCLEGPELWCFIPYPYKQPRTVSAEDMRWLEHDLLFMFKKLDAFGANFWNGIYYRMEVTEQGLRGVAHSLDLNMLASPPDDLTTPPIEEFDVDEADLEKRWLPYLEIR